MDDDAPLMMAAAAAGTESTSTPADQFLPHIPHIQTKPRASNSAPCTPIVPSSISRIKTSVIESPTTTPTPSPPPPSDYLWPTSGAMATRLQSMRHIIARRMSSIGSESDNSSPCTVQGYFGDRPRQRGGSTGSSVLGRVRSESCASSSISELCAEQGSSAAAEATGQSAGSVASPPPTPSPRPLANGHHRSGSFGRTSARSRLGPCTRQPSPEGDPLERFATLATPGVLAGGVLAGGVHGGSILDTPQQQQDCMATLLSTCTTPSALLRTNVAEGDTVMLDLTFSTLPVYKGGDDKSSVVGSELTLNAFTLAPRKRDTLLVACRSLVQCLQTADALLLQTYEQPFARLDKQRMRLKGLCQRIQHFGADQTLDDLSELQVETLLSALFLILVTSDFFKAYQPLFAMAGHKAHDPGTPYQVRMEVLRSVMPHVRETLDKLQSDAGAVLLEGEALVVDVYTGFVALPLPLTPSTATTPVGMFSTASTPRSVATSPPSTPLPGLYAAVPSTPTTLSGMTRAFVGMLGGTNAGTRSKPCTGNSLQHTHGHPSCTPPANATHALSARPIAHRPAYKVAVLDLDAMFHPHTLVPGLLDVFSALQSYTEVADGFLRELLATAAPHHELVLDLLGSRGSFWGGSGRRVFVLSDSPPEWAIPAAQLLLGSKLPAANVLCREVKDKVEWLRGLLTAPPTLAPSTPTSGTALLGVGLLVGRDVLLIDGSREVVAWAQAEGCSTLLISGVHDAEVALHCSSKPNSRNNSGSTTASTPRGSSWGGLLRTPLGSQRALVLSEASMDAPVPDSTGLGGAHTSSTSNIIAKAAQDKQHNVIEIQAVAGAAVLSTQHSAPPARSTRWSRLLRLARKKRT